MRVLAIGAHPDDVELGCGATLARASAEGAAVTMLVLTDGGLGPTGHDPRHLEQAQAAALLGAELRWGGFADGRLRHGTELVDVISRVLDEAQPDLVLTHAAQDSHQDHVATAAATVAAARRHAQVLHYESPSTLAFLPTVFADVAGHVEAKLGALRCHLSQVVGSVRVDLEAIEAQLRFRGHQGRLREAEAFEVTRTLLHLIPAPRGTGRQATTATATAPADERSRP